MSMRRSINRYQLPDESEFTLDLASDADILSVQARDENLGEVYLWACEDEAKDTGDYTWYFRTVLTGESMEFFSSSEYYTYSHVGSIPYRGTTKHVFCRVEFTVDLLKDITAECRESAVVEVV